MVAADTLRIDGTDLTRPPQAVVQGFRAAIDAALAHLGNTAPNPPVGCAILDRAGRLLATGGHVRAGEPHAEALALAALRESGQLDQADTLLVTLEPCNHHGRTGPCTEAILASPVRTVWIGCPDPNPRVAGHGAQRLAAAGLSVRQLPPGREHRDCAALIVPFRRWAAERRPWITIKQAMDRNGGMIPPPGATTFTGPASLRLAHRLRRATDAVIAGAGTIRADRPALTVRHVPDHPGRRRILAIVGRGALPEGYVAQAEARGFTVRQVDRPDALPALLGEAGVLWAMVEAGPTLLRGLEEAGLWDDRLVIGLSPGRPSPGRTSPDRLAIETARPDALSPLLLLPELAGLDQEGACSLAS